MKRKIYKLISSAKHGLFALALVVAGTGHAQTTFTFAYTGAVQTLTLPAGSWGLEVWAANGGSVNTLGGQGIGGYSKGAYNVLTTGTQLNIFVGGKGIQSSGNSSTAGAGGWNGGGGGAAVGYSGAGGGGATDVRVGGTAAANRVIVAGGGGGAAYYGSSLVSTSVAAGGNGGAVLAQNGNTITIGGVITVGGGANGANGSSPGLAAVGTANGDANGGGGGGSSAGASIGQPGTGGGAGGAAGPSAGGLTGSAGGGGGGYAGGAGGVQAANGAAAGGGGSGYIGGLTNAITTMSGQTGYVPSPDLNGNGYVIITRLCDVAISASKNPICVGESVTLFSNAGSNILWSTGATTSSIVVTPQSTTGYTMSGVSSSSTACSSTVSVIIDVNPLPTLSLYSFPPVICEGGSGILGASGASTFTWSTGASGSTVAVTPSLSGVYTATGTSPYGCKNTETVSVTLNTNSLTVTQNTSVCKGSSINLTAVGVSSAVWSTGASFLSILVTPSVTTVYTVSGPDDLGCILTNSVTINVLNLPAVNISADKQTVCRGESVVLTASGGASYVWDSAETTAVVTKTISVNIPYEFSVTGTGANGCTSMQKITVTGSACSGLNENNINRISVSPNPVNHQITISGATATAKTILITDITGKSVLQTEGNTQQINVNVESLPAGVYNIQVTEGDVTISQKFIKL